MKNEEIIFFPADLVKNERTACACFVPFGTIILSQNNISYRKNTWFLRYNLLFKYIYKYCTKETIAYNNIISMQKGSGWFGNYLKIITDEINGSYYISLPKNQENNLDLIYRLIQCYQEADFDSSSVRLILNNIQNAAEKVKKEYKISGIILMLLGLVISLFWPGVACFVFAFSYFISCASGSMLLRLLNIIFMFCMITIRLVN